MSLIIVGAGQGMGRAIGRRFAAEGMPIGLVARSAESLEQIAEDISRTSTGPPPVDHERADITDEAALTSAVQALATRLGPPEVLVYNASLFIPTAPARLTPRELRETLEVCAVGAQTAVRAVVDGMLRRRTGTIILTGGGTAINPTASAAALSVGKAAVRALALTLYQDLSPAGIHAGTITIRGYIKPGTDFDPDRIAETFWAFHAEPRESWSAEAQFTG